MAIIRPGIEKYAEAGDVIQLNKKWMDLDRRPCPFCGCNDRSPDNLRTCGVKLAFSGPEAHVRVTVLCPRSHIIKLEYRPVSAAAGGAHKCTCPRDVLWAKGCQCGGI